VGTELELTAEQAVVVAAFVAAMEAMGAAIQGLDRVGLDAVTALKSLPGEDGEGTVYDSLPLQIRLLLG
jgi:hypothetical protein